MKHFNNICVQTRKPCDQLQRQTDSTFIFTTNADKENKETKNTLFNLIKLKLKAENKKMIIRKCNERILT